ncbi:conserved hypothetical protein [Nostocoides japonicum T1-X7]|uniref:DUF559 domain-containing protein n=1 Tax=Nostocoides japonicum T1-X7 TaxID=1194083 RepID=A0A077LU96_9MICO|nr:hypothetical protein [Tetrasphaera japonica]CCH77056.1 conserved hypothetical protein [Tetrasphaera japonica T1-X7]
MSFANLDIDRPFTHADAVRAGISDGQLRGPAHRQLFRGVYISADVTVDPWLLSRAVLLVASPNVVVARHTAAQLWRGVVPDSWRVHVTTLWPRAEVRASRRRHLGPDPARAETGGQLDVWGRMALDGVDARVSIDHTRTTVLRGIRLTDPVRTFLDLAEDLDLVELVVLGDSLVRQGLATPADLVGAAAEPGRHRRKARRAAAYVRPGVASAQESRLRMLLVLAGLPEPEVDIQLRDEDGELLRQLDLGYREEMVAVEYDGRQHIKRVEEWERDIDRREELADWDWRIVTVVSNGIWQQPERTLGRVVAALRARGRRVAVTSDEWERYFGRDRRTKESKGTSEQAS